MENLIPSFVDITNWNKNPYSSTGGTRAKKIYIHPDNEIDYFFKGSKELEDGTIRYPLEFWSEIVSSKIGQWLNFDMLDYNIGYDYTSNQKVGCLSKSMIENTANTLTEGLQYLRGYNSKYDPSKSEHEYTFEFIVNTLDNFQLIEFEDNIVSMMIFDAIIGNSDRHQENWGVITLFQETIEELENKILFADGIWKTIIPSIQKSLTKLARNLRKFEEGNKKGFTRTTLINQSVSAKSIFAPIYDSGCCLGRELEDLRVEKMLNDPQMLNNYVNNGESEVRWRVGKKTKHFDLMSEIKNKKQKLFTQIKSQIEESYSLEKLEFLIHTIDNNLPNELKEHKLPDLRKELMVKLITLRINRFLEL